MESLEIETSRAADIELFKRFREKGFDATPRNTAALHTKQREELEEFLLTQTEKLKVFLEREKAVESYSRGDYKELLRFDGGLHWNEQRKLQVCKAWCCASG